MSKGNTDPYENLANAIILQAVRDYRDARKRLKGGRKNAEKFMKALKVASIETHVADARTCCLHPASATHRQLSDEELIACGVSADLVRYSCGLENKDDLIEDIAQALDSIEI